MKPEYYIKTLIFILVLAVISFSGCIQNLQNQTTHNQTSGQNPTTSNQTLNPATTSKYTVIAQNFTFTPRILMVPTGTTVTWINEQQSTTHNVYSDTGTFQSKNLNNGDSYSFKFIKSGTYRYHCTIHPNMTGTIIVQ